MDKRRSRPFQLPGTAQSLKPWIITYLTASIIILTATALTLFFGSTGRAETSGSVHGAFLIYCAVALSVMLVSGIALVIQLARKYAQYTGGPLKHITEAMDKMSKGHLGWKLSLHRKAELGDVAESITKASQSLAQRINNIKLRTRQLNEVEDYLIDTLGADNFYNPYAIKALRKLKITTTRLNSDISEFQLSALNQPAAPLYSNSAPRDKTTTVQL